MPASEGTVIVQQGRIAKTAPGDTAEPDPRQRILTIPNAISVARLAGVPVFLWLVLGVASQAADWWAVGLLIASGLSDWLDGRLARALNQQSSLGEVLDPAADRLYIVATVIALAVRSIIPWWLVGVLGARELLLGFVLLVLRRHGYPALRVSFAGKAATLCLLYAFPVLLLGSHASGYAETARVLGWAFVIWGSALYWCAAVLYTVQARHLVVADRRKNGAGSPAPWTRSTAAGAGSTAAGAGETGNRAGHSRQVGRHGEKANNAADGAGGHAKPGG
ncbi:MAG TPA: CDP-alcohol phosphatidyltransferase family protein [Streptosporangiaceae bacterium]|nr:CDP-alcohol phosphatidyltransferase family protein [Streptosporangiaceae bacterium]